MDFPKDRQLNKPRLKGINDLLKDSFRFYKEHFLRLTVISLVTFGVASLITSFIIPEGLESEILRSTPYPFLALPGVWFSLVFSFTSLLSIYGSAVLTVSIKEAAEEKGLKDFFQEAWSKYLPFLITSLLAALVINLGFLLLIIPGIIFMVWFAFLSYIIVCEGIYYIAAFKRSKELVRGYWWQVFSKNLFLILLAFPIVSFFSFVFLKAPYLSSFFLVIIFSPFFMIYNYIIYKELKSIKSQINI